MSSASAEMSAVAAAEQSAAPEALLGLLGHLQVEMGVDLGLVRLTLGDLIDLAPGTRLHVDRQGRTDVLVSIQGQYLLAGALLERERRLAVRLVPQGAGE